ncbi:N-acetylmuramoyl-L-alanine amidase [Streptomyces sp. NPDC059781]|uniref:peptidoglycan recognition protein family protein n=2 Tax=unclassified Streptomyces TaxID=2593676 RepID=UPI00365693DA
MVYIVPRSAWNARAPRKHTDDPWTPWEGGVIVHHKGPGSGYPYQDHQGCYEQVRVIQLDHIERRVWDDIAYNYLVCTHGWVFEGRGGKIRSAANDDETTGANQNWFAVMGMIEEGDEPSSAMLQGIREIIAHVRQYEKAGPGIGGHMDVATTECPGRLYRYVTSGSLEPGGPVPSPPPQIEIVPRAQWGARPARAVSPVQPSARTGFTVHYSAGPPTQTPRQIQNYHMDSNGWDDIGYNFLVDRAGRVYEGRGWNVQGAHATGHNITHIGACFIGRDGEATPATLRAIRALYLHANKLTGKTLAKTWHGGLSGQATSCPGSSLRAWVQGGMAGDDVPVADGTGGGSGGGMTSVRSVAAQQRAVNELGYSPALEADGIWGPKTDAGVRWLQQKVGVTADGLWGPDTEAAYRTATGGTGGGSGGGGMTSVRSVAAQQRAVNGLGYSPALEADGIWGPKTDAGVRWLQQKVGVTADGLWGPDTEAAYHAYLGEGARLDVDGVFGPATVAATQRAVGATADGQWGPASVRALQQHLNNWGSAGLTVDGDMGPATVSALQRHLNKMTKAGLGVDGVWGPATVRALQKALNLGKL